MHCKYLFRDVVIGWPGSVHGARILSNSTIYDKGNDNNFFPDIRESIGGQVVSIVILGDPAYPLLPWLLKAYPEHVYTPQSQRVFNYRLNRARMTIENTFGRWKGRFRRFSKRLDMEVPGVVNLISALCITFRRSLHLCMYYRSCTLLTSPLEKTRNQIYYTVVQAVYFNGFFCCNLKQFNMDRFHKVLTLLSLC